MIKHDKILVIQTAFLGDVNLALPMAQTIKNHLPDSWRPFMRNGKSSWAISLTSLNMGDLLASPICKCCNLKFSSTTNEITALGFEATHVPQFYR